MNMVFLILSFFMIFSCTTHRKVEDVWHYRSMPNETCRELTVDESGKFNQKRDFANKVEYKKVSRLCVDNLGNNVLIDVYFDEIIDSIHFKNYEIKDYILYSPKNDVIIDTWSSITIH